MNTYICTFPDRTRVEVNILNKSPEGTQTQVQWTSERGLVSSVWVPSKWVLLKGCSTSLSV